MAAHDGDGVQLRRQGQQTVAVFQQHDGFLGVGLADGGVGVQVKGAVVLHPHRMVHHAVGEHGAHDAAGHVVQPGRRDLPVEHRLLQGGVEIGRRVERVARLLIEPVAGGADGGVGGAPVRHHVTGIGPVALEHMV